jgi:hypothetical protein
MEPLELFAWAGLDDLHPLDLYFPSSRDDRLEPVLLVEDLVLLTILEVSVHGWLVLLLLDLW